MKKLLAILGASTLLTTQTASSTLEQKVIEPQERPASEQQDPQTRNHQAGISITDPYPAIKTMAKYVAQDEYATNSIQMQVKVRVWGRDARGRDGPPSEWSDGYPDIEGLIEPPYSEITARWTHPVDGSPVVVYFGELVVRDMDTGEWNYGAALQIPGFDPEDYNDDPSIIPIGFLNVPIYTNYNSETGYPSEHQQVLFAIPYTGETVLPQGNDAPRGSRGLEDHIVDDGSYNTRTPFRLGQGETEERQAYPNPFNSAINIPVPDDALRFRVYNVKGELVDDMPVVEGQDIVWKPQNLPSAIYLYRFELAQQDGDDKLILGVAPKKINYVK